MGIDVTGKITNEQYNCFRLQEVRYKIITKLRERFHREFSEDPKTLYDEVMKHNKTLQKLKKKKILNDYQYKMIFNPSKTIQTRKFDEHTLIILIIYLYKLPQPTTGWFTEPKKNDVSESATLVRLIHSRNYIQHAPVSLSDKRFQNIFSYVKKPVLDYGVCTEDELQGIITMFPSKEEIEIYREMLRRDEIKKKEAERLLHLQNCIDDGVLYNLYPTIPNFISREKELQEIHQKMMNLKGSLGVLIHGIAGVGKSELARKYCNEFYKDYDNNVLWIDSENMSTIENSFLEAAKMIQLTIAKKDGSLMEFRLILQKVYNFLAIENC